jgi:hypothetical protein
MSYAIRPTALCRCYSGKLYRDCCQRLTKLPKNASADLRRRYWGKLVDECAVSILDFLDQKEVLDQIRDEAVDHILTEVERTVELEPFLVLLDAYTLFHYPIDLPDDVLDESDLEDEDDTLEAVPAALLYAMHDDRNVWSKGDRREVFRELLESPFSWYRIAEVVPGDGVRLQDIILDQEVFVNDRMLSRSAEKGWIICAKVLHFDGVSLVHGVGSIPLPAPAFTMMRELGAKVRESAQAEFGEALDRISLAMMAQIVVSTYLRSTIDLQESSGPEIRNTDGDPMEPAIIRYAFQAASVAQVVERIKAVLDRVADGPDEEVEERDASGHPVKVVVPYVRPPLHEGMMDVVLAARFIVESHSVTVEVNSVNRATEMKRLVEQRLGDLLSFVSEESAPLGSFMSMQHPGQMAGGEMPPEVREALDKHMRDLQEKWLTQSIPALGGLTPQEAAKTREGRLMLESLLDGFAARSTQVTASSASVGTFDVEELRARLGMKELD